MTENDLKRIALLEMFDYAAEMLLDCAIGLPINRKMPVV
jgi:hypothetical protein